jgi:hypothetical protein
MLSSKDHKRVYERQKGQETFMSGPYTTIKDEFGSEIKRVKNSELLKSPKGADQRPTEWTKCNKIRYALRPLRRARRGLRETKLLTTKVEKPR